MQLNQVSNGGRLVLLLAGIGALQQLAWGSRLGGDRSITPEKGRGSRAQYKYSMLKLPAELNKKSEYWFCSQLKMHKCFCERKYMKAANFAREMDSCVRMLGWGGDHSPNF